VSLFPVFQTTGSGLYANRVWMDSVSDNLANINTIRPYDQPAFQARYVIAQSVEGSANDPVGIGSGVRVAGVTYGNAQGRLRYQPDSPMANKQGIVRYPDIDMGDQLVMLIQAQRAYQMNLQVIDRARDSYQQALQIKAG
jgi:flagellar basal-body rod protein FlgC